MKPDDFIYADPPYDVEFRQYAKEGFEWPEQVRLAEWLAHHPGPVVLSNQGTDRVIDLYRECGFDTRTLPASYVISCTRTGLPRSRCWCGGISIHSCKPLSAFELLPNLSALVIVRTPLWPYQRRSRSPLAGGRIDPNIGAEDRDPPRPGGKRGG